MLSIRPMAGVNCGLANQEVTMIRDRNIDLTYFSYWRNVQQFQSQFALTLTEGTPNTVTIDNAATAAVVLEEVGTTGYVGLKMNTAGNLVNDLIPVPPTWNRATPLYARVHYATGSSTNTDTVTWKVFLTQASAGDALETATDALETVIATDAVNGTANSLAATTWGKLELGQMSRQTVPSYLLVTVEMDAKSGITEDIYLLGYEILYYPALCGAPDGYFDTSHSIAAPANA